MYHHFLKPIFIFIYSVFSQEVKLGFFILKDFLKSQDYFKILNMCETRWGFRMWILLAEFSAMKMELGFLMVLINASIIR